ncbi:DUF305 domain-containing protein [Tsukamurella sp. 8F]|uniref:DUF305 domain-containing protein n=1 Tax=unclassified Tsukamurella TaxID=2633480 RepID=UPI0023B9DB19|nr:MULTISPECIES: DUF305 domain-containing protein [unclassified Tsukamurella]MDF0530764.1 DUF305 domain-containing protein [Tsukamurella sp. 8J]MDF0587965.1 DUF305 domain-containing protein [Tsukamurella sp. 8F]
MIRNTTARIATGLLASSLALGGCTTAATDTGSPSTAVTSAVSSSAAASGARFAPADVDFAEMMYPHHAQAVEMSKMVAGKDAGPDVVALAKQIEGAQQPEMDAFARLLRQWGKPAPSASMGHHMDGMMTDEQMQHLGTLRGSAFDKAWLQMMIAHHRGAITMADAELKSGVDPEARTIAQDIKASQQAEIDRMQKLLG